MSWSQKHGVWVWVIGTLGLIGFAGTLCVVVGQFLEAKASDQLAAAAALLGGFIGALGTAFAVYLTLASQRKDEAEKVEGALRFEVSEFARLAYGQYGAIQLALTQGYPIPLRDLPTLSQMPEAVVFRSTADRVSRLAYGPLLVVMHARIAEAMQMVRIYAAAGAPPALAPPGLGHLAETQAIAANRATLDNEKATTLATAWFDVCDIARMILKRDPSGFELAEASITAVLKDLDELHGRRAAEMGREPAPH